MMTLAKGLTAAYMPLGGVVVNKKVADYFEDHVLETGLTYSGHPMSCAAGLAALETYEREGLVQRSKELGAWMHGQLREMAEDHPSVGDIRGQGLFAQIEFVKAGSTDPLAKWPQTPPVLRQLCGRGSQARDEFCRARKSADSVPHPSSSSRPSGDGLVGAG